MHQQPQHAPLFPNKVARSRHLSRVTGSMIVAALILGPSGVGLAGHVAVHDVATGDVLGNFEQPGLPFLKIAISADGRFVAGLVNWNVLFLSMILELKSHSNIYE